jgi:hydrogenase-4 component B
VTESRTLRSRAWGTSWARERGALGAAEPGAWLLLVAAVRLASIVLALGACRRPRLSLGVAFGGSAVASALTGALGLLSLGDGIPARGLLTHGASGLTFGYAVDALSGFFLVVLALVGGAVAVYSLAYFAHGYGPGRVAFVGVAFNLLLGSVEMVLVADGAIGFLFAWELMTLTTAALVATEHERAQSRRAAFLYLAMSHVGTGCLVVAFLFLGNGAPSLGFADVLGPHAAAAPHRDVLFLLFLAGFGVKAGVIPLHVWLPEAHPAAPSPISALMSGVLIKTGIYGIFRVCAFGLGTPAMGWGGLVFGLGAVSMVLGVLYALMQHDLKRLLAYHSIENIGIILVAAGVGMLALSSGRPELATLAFAASLLHVLNHALFKALLFLGAGGVVAATGTRQIEEMGGLVRRMPWTAGFFLLGAAAISGLPFLNGFVSEWLVFQSLLSGFHASRDTFVRVAFPIGAALLGLTTALAAACFVKAFGITFLALPRSAAAAGARESHRLMLAPQALLAAACVVLGLVPGPAVEALARLVGGFTAASPVARVADGLFRIAPSPPGFDWLSLPAVALAMACALALAALLGARSPFRLRSAPTWGCGGELSAQTEYTATAFSKPLMMIFGAIYRPTREVSRLETAPYYAREVHYRAEVEPTFERFVYRPLTRAILGLADRMRFIQAGSLHAYLGYVMTLVLVLVMYLWWKG